MKTYVLMVAKTYPAYHSKGGQLTKFMLKIWDNEKLHTFRANYELWVKRAENINAGLAILSVRQWTDKPYRSKQKQEFTQTKLTIQKAELIDNNTMRIDGKHYDLSDGYIANNDGLSLNDFREWFKKYPKKPLALIHFTNLKY
jgi:hypothetical protein